MDSGAGRDVVVVAAAIFPPQGRPGDLVTLAGVVVIGLALPAFARYHAQSDEPREASQPTPAPA